MANTIKNRCTSCGKSLRPEFQRCPYCGTPVVQTSIACGLALTIVSGPTGQGTYPLDATPVTIGRGPENAICLEADEHVSWEHAELRLTPAGLVIADLDSTNGTYVNGERITEPTVVQAGDEVRLGSQTVLQLAPQATATPIQPRPLMSRVPLIAGGSLLAVAMILAVIMAIMPKSPGASLRIATTRISLGLPQHANARITKLVSPLAQTAGTDGARLKYGEHQLVTALDQDDDPVGFVFPSSSSTTVSSTSTAIALIRLSLHLAPGASIGNVTAGDINEQTSEVQTLAIAVEEALTNDPKALVDPPETLMDALRNADSSIMSRGLAAASLQQKRDILVSLGLVTPAYAQYGDDEETKGYAVEWSREKSNPDITHCRITNHRKRWLVVVSNGQPEKTTIPSSAALISFSTATGSFSQYEDVMFSSQQQRPQVGVYGWGIGPEDPDPAVREWQFQSLLATTVMDGAFPIALTALGIALEDSIRDEAGKAILPKLLAATLLTADVPGLSRLSRAYNQRGIEGLLKGVTDYILKKGILNDLFGFVLKVAARKFGLFAFIETSFCGPLRAAKLLLTGMEVGRIFVDATNGPIAAVYQSPFIGGEGYAEKPSAQEAIPQNVNNTYCTISGQIINAVTGKTISGILVAIHEGTADGKVLASINSDDNGYYEFTDVHSGIYSITTVASGFSNAEHDLNVNTGDDSLHQNIVLNPIMVSKSMRIVLTWNEYPSDLDAHLLCPRIDGNTPHVYFGAQYPPGATANLDIDDTNGYGPETITIAKNQEGRYQYYVHLFSTNGSFTTSNARVDVYTSNRRIPTSFFVPTTGSGKYWRVFDIDGVSLNLTPMNTLTNENPSGFLETTK